MRVLILGLLFSLGIATNAHSAIILTVSQQNAGPIALNSTAVFNVFATSDAGSINNFAGLDFFIDANDSGLVGNITTGGTIVSGTSNFFTNGGGFVPGVFPNSFGVFSANQGAGLSLTGAPQLVATITLNTAGAVAGNYTMGLSNIAAVDPGSNALAASGTGVGYTLAVSAVPEPSTIVLLSVGVCGVFGRRVLKRRKDKIA